MHQPSDARGFSLVEVVISMLVVSVLLAAALRAVGASKTGQLTVANRTEAMLLAQDLLAEIVVLPYEDQDTPTSSIGPEAGESGAHRSAFDDVDDYHAWNGEPPVEKDGAAIASASNMQRDVTVTWAKPSDLSASGFSGTGIKRIEVVVRVGNRELARMFAFRCSANRNPFEIDRLSNIELVR